LVYAFERIAATKIISKFCQLHRQHLTVFLYEKKKTCEKGKAIILKADITLVQQIKRESVARHKKTSIYL